MRRVSIAYRLFLVSIILSSLANISLFRNFSVPDFFILLSFYMLLLTLLIRGTIPVSFIKLVPFFFTSGLFIFSSLVSILLSNSVEFLESIFAVIQFIFIFFIMIPLFVYFILSRKRTVFLELEKITVLFLASGVLLSIIAVLHYYTGISIILITISGMGRYGSYLGVGGFSHFLAIVWPFALHYSLNGKTKLKGIFGFISLIALTLGSFLSAARFSFIAIPSITLMYIFLYYLGRGTIKTYFLMLVVIVLLLFSGIVVFYNPDSLQKIIDSISITDVMVKKLSSFPEALETGSIATLIPERIDAFSDAYDYLSKNPIFGIGLDQQKNYYGARAHITLLTTWVEGGFLAMLSIVFLYFIIFQKGFYIIKKANSHSETSIVSALTASFFGSFLSGFQAPMVIQNRFHWISASLILATYCILRDRGKIGSTRKRGVNPG